MRWGTDVSNGVFAARMLKEQHPSDEIILSDECVKLVFKTRDMVLGEKNAYTVDMLWANTVPLKDFETTTMGGQTIRFCIFDDALEHLNEVPVGETALVGAIQECGTYGFTLLGVTAGADTARLSTEIFDKNGKPSGRVQHIEAYEELMGLWHAIQIALLHPQVKDVFAGFRKVKKYERVDTPERRRKRVVRYIRQHVINPEMLNRTVREIHRHCLAWYVIGHWRHYKDGRVIFIKPYWKGELRAAKRNFDDRERKIAAGGGNEG